MSAFDLNQIQHIHFMGIKGVGMTALAVIAKQLGKKVTGSDTAEVFITDHILKENGIIPLVGFAPEHTIAADLVVATGAHGGKTNIECQAAIERGIPVLMHAEALGLFSQDKRVLAVSGCHGKTTTSAILSWIMVQARTDPSYALGTSEVTSLGAAAHAGKGDYFVIEADEYMTCPRTDRTPRFHYLTPYVALINNIDFDHPDRYQDLAETQAAFTTFANKTRQDGAILVNTENAASMELLKAGKWPAKVVTFGENPEADFVISAIETTPDGVAWTLTHQADQESIRFDSSLFGEHNTYNASAAAITAKLCGVPLVESQKHVATFGGLKRRSEFKGKFGEVPVFDDYGHHPAEIKATLQAFRERYPTSRLVVAFQPHTSSRTAALLDDFGSAFESADAILLIKTFSSARQDTDGGQTETKLADLLKTNYSGMQGDFNEEEALTWTKTNLTKGDVFLTIGAGNLYEIGEVLIQG